MKNSVRCFTVIFSAVLLASGLAGCSSSAAARVEREPLTVLRNPQRPLQEREAAADSAWKQAQKSPEDKAAVRATFKEMVWSASLPSSLRGKLYVHLADDPDPESIEDTRRLTRLMIPREPSREMELFLCQTAAAKGWADCIPALIRSYSRPVPLVKDQDRAERIALIELGGSTPLIETVFAVFLNPPDEDPDSPAEFKARTRADAYDVLGRLDVSGAYRKRLLEDPNLTPDAQPIVALLRRSMSQLKVIPISGEELRWLERLADPKNARNAAWWSEVQGIVASMPPEKLDGLQMRHLEPIRVASLYHPDLFAKDRSMLLSELKSAIGDRKTVQRSNEAQGLVKAHKEQVEFWEHGLSWGDLLTISLLDRAVRQKDFVERLFVYVGLDREDRTTEYGGLILTVQNVGDGSATSGNPGKIVAWLFPPRPGQRPNDTEFIAPEEMILSSDRALAHFHFHVHRARNSEVAGPSGGDLAYAALSGRDCLVFTSLSTEELDVDYYQPNGVVVDLGTILQK
ncbi:MAG: hypothetical protein KF805_00945 [Phycisphaeraceae bacterium]|nr:hypothetical protein [Phycisphaeraceae bacterium]